MIWLSIGSSPLAVEATAKAREDFAVDKIITCNSGILIEPLPDVYFLSDAIACRDMGSEARRAHAAGSRCVTLRRSDHALEKRGVEWFDEIMDEAPPYEPFKLSGLWTLEYAARNGADVILLAGHDGWGGPFDYFRKELGKTTHMTNWSQDIIKPRCQLLADKYPNIRWIQYGQPRYKVEAHNWTVNEL